MRAIALFTALASAGLLTNIPGLAAGNAAGATVRLTNISTRVHAKGASLVIEATEPVPYLTARPDPLTVLVDLRNVGSEEAATLAGALKSVQGSPIAHVAVVSAESNGEPVSRVRVELAEPVAHHVRSDKNTIVVDFEKTSAQQTALVVPVASRAAPDAMRALETVSAVNQPAPIKLVVDPAKAVQAIQAAPAVAAAPARSVPTRAFQADQAVQPPGGQATSTNRVYSGHPVSLDFQGADLRAVLRTFAEISGLNMVIDPAVQGSVDVSLREVPWDQALELILRANKLEYRADGTIIRIAPREIFIQEDADRAKQVEAQALAGDLRVLTRTISYAKATDLQALITRSALSQRGTVQVDGRTNTLIITDLQERLVTASELIDTLDRAEPQVEIEARIVRTTRNFARALGVKWGFNGRVDPALGNTTNLAFPNNGSLSGRTGGLQGPNGSPTAVDFGVAGSAVGLALGSVNGAFNLDVELSALEEDGNGRILSTPRVSTLNNVEAEMTQGLQIPIQTTSNQTTVTTFKDAALSLRVQPQITASGTVIMKITLENSQANFSSATPQNPNPSIDTQRAITTLLVKDGETTVIGGIYMSDQANAQERTPGLSQIPLLKWLFKRDLVRDESSELLIFITPRIVKN